MTGLILIVAIVLIIAIIKLSSEHTSDQNYESWGVENSKERVGRIGEQEATRIIRSVLREDDRLFTNVQVIYEDRKAELKYSFSLENN